MCKNRNPIHIKCLREYLLRKYKRVPVKGQVFWDIREMKCDICRQTLPTKYFNRKGDLVPLIEPYPSINAYALFSFFSNDRESKIVTYLMLNLRNKKEFSFGNDVGCDVNLPDTSLIFKSSIKFRKFIYLKDLNNYPVTSLLVKNLEFKKKKHYEIIFG